MLPVNADLHNHLRTSSVWKDEDFNRTINLAGPRLELCGLVGLINFSDTRYETFIDLPGYPRNYHGEHKNVVESCGMYIIKGQEVPTEQGHLLVLGLGAGKHLKEGRPLEDSLKEAQDHNAIIIADHPFGRDGLGHYLSQKQELIPQFDAIETFNGEAIPIPGILPFNANRYAQHFHDQISGVHQIGKISASDGHSFYELGKNWTRLVLDEKKGFLNNKSDVTTDLRRAIRETGDYSWDELPREENHSIIGTYDHIADLATLMALSKVPESIRKPLGLNKYFEVKRPGQ